MSSNILRFPVRAVLAVASGPTEWTDANVATARPLPVARVQHEHSHDFVATEDTTCGLCGDPIAKGDIVTFVRERANDADKVVHPDCMASDLAKALRILSARGCRGRRR